jgi:hypothetical protein
MSDVISFDKFKELVKLDYSSPLTDAEFKVYNENVGIHAYECQPSDSFSAYQYIDGTWFLFGGRGITGKGETLSQAIENESNQYNSSMLSMGR